MKIQYQDKHCIVFESALFRTTSTLIITPSFLLLVDPNWLPLEVAFIRQHLEQQSKGQPLYLLFTHSDYDHIIGWQAFPEAQVIASAAFVHNSSKTKIIEQINNFDDEYYIRRTYPIAYPKVDLIIAEAEQQLDIGDFRLSFYQAPGHNADGLFTFLAPLGIWIAGDYLSNIEFPYIYHSSHDYLNTLDKAQRILDNQSPQLLIPGHGDATTDHQEMQRRIKDSYRYLHQLQESVANNQPFDLEKLWQQYQFPKVMQGFHEANVELVRKEKRGE